MAGCKCGLQKWTTVVVMNIPFLICARCGQGLPKAVVNDTMTHREIHDLQKPKRKPKPWKEEMREIIESVWEKKYGSESKPRR